MPIHLILVIVALIVLIGFATKNILSKIKSILYKSFQWVKYELSSNKSLSNKFDDLLYWKVGDEISVYYGDGYSIRKRIASFKEDGVYTVRMSDWLKYKEGVFDMDDIAEKAEFVRASEIVSNNSVKLRKKKEDFLNTVENDVSYNNQLIEIQNELENLNDNHNGSINRQRI